MKIVGVSIWIWAMGLIVIAFGIFAATSMFSGKPTSLETSQIGPILTTNTALHYSGQPDTRQRRMSKRDSENDDRHGIAVNSFLPSGLGNWRLGMSLSEFKKALPGLKYEVFGDFRITTTKANPCPDVVEITAYFDMSSENMLYELIVEYDSDSAFDRAFGLVRHNPKWQNSWLISLTGDTYVRAWTYEKKFVYKHLGDSPEHEEGGVTTATQLQERRILKLLK